jgi:hypothetical protein
MPSIPENRIIPGLKETQEVILMAVALAQLTMQVKEAIDRQVEFNWLLFAGSFPALLPSIVGAFNAVKDGIEGVEEVTLEFSKLTKEQQVELKEWAQAQVPDLADDKVEQFIKDSFAVVIDLYMIVKTYFMVNLVVPPTTGSNTPSPVETDGSEG